MLDSCLRGDDNEGGHDSATQVPEGVVNGVGAVVPALARVGAEAVAEEGRRGERGLRLPRSRRRAILLVVCPTEDFFECVCVCIVCVCGSLCARLDTDRPKKRPRRRRRR